MTLKDNSNGTINITHGPPAPERANAGGFFTLGSGSGFGLGGNSSRRRNRRIRARQQAKQAARAADAQRKAEAQAVAEHQARASAIVHAQTQAAAAKAQLIAAQTAHFHHAVAVAANRHRASRQDPIKQIEQALRALPPSPATAGPNGMTREIDRVERLLVIKRAQLHEISAGARHFMAATRWINPSTTTSRNSSSGAFR